MSTALESSRFRLHPPVLLPVQALSTQVPTKRVALLVGYGEEIGPAAFATVPILCAVGADGDER